MLDSLNTNIELEDKKKSANNALEEEIHTLKEETITIRIDYKKLLDTLEEKNNIIKTVQDTRNIEAQEIIHTLEGRIKNINKENWNNRIKYIIPIIPVNVSF